MKNFNKHILCAFIAACCAAALSSCNDPKNHEPKAPPAPTALTAGEVTDASAVLSWSGGSTAYEVVVGNDKHEATLKMELSVTGLKPGTNYTWKVRAKQDDLYSEWTLGAPFTTVVGPITADDLAGTWKVSGYFVTKPEIYTEDRTLTIAKIDDRTVRISDMLGLAKYFLHTPASVDVFEATVENNAISIASQSFKPSFDYDGWPVQLCRFMHDNSETESVNWKLGFDNIPISRGDMTIDFGAGGHKYDTGNGIYKFETIDAKDIFGTFIPLTTDPSGKDKKIFGYKLWWCNTIWTKLGASEKSDNVHNRQ